MRVEDAVNEVANDAAQCPLIEADGYKVFRNEGESTLSILSWVKYEGGIEDQYGCLFTIYRLDANGDEVSRDSASADLSDEERWATSDEDLIGWYVDIIEELISNAKV